MLVKYVLAKSLKHKLNKIKYFRSTYVSGSFYVFYDFLQFLINGLILLILLFRI